MSTTDVVADRSPAKSSWLQRRRSIGGTLALLVIAVLLPTFALQARSYLLLQRQRSEAELAASLALARATAIAVQDFVHDVLGELLPIGAVLDAGVPARTSDATKLLGATVAEYPALREISWLDASGKLLASSSAVATALPEADRALIERALAGQDRAVTELSVSPLDDEPVFYLVRALRGEGGRLRELLVATVVARRLGPLLVPFDRGDGGAITLFDRRGRIVYRRPELALAWAQRDVLTARARSSESPLAAALAGREKVGSVVSILDGQTRLTAVVPVAPLGWAVSASRPEEAALAPVRVLFWDNAAGDAVLLALGLGLAVALGGRIVRPVRALEARALAFGSGRPPQQQPPMRLRELGALSAAFDRMEEGIALRDRQRDDLLHIVSHDLRTPLGTVMGHAALLRSDVAPPSRAATSASAILAAAKRMNGMIEDLLDFARFESGQLKLALEPVDLASFLTEALSRLSDLNRKRVKLVFERPGAIVVRADPGRLERILLNLVTNALKYSPGHSEVVVSVSRSEELVGIAVADEGLGIPDADLPHVFDRFYRGSTGVGGGLGLGLYSARMLAEAHGGNIRVEQRREEGTVFYVSLPMRTGEPGPSYG